MQQWRDWQSLLYMLLLPTLVVWSWSQPYLTPWLACCLYLLILFLIIGVGCISHNHAHRPIWKASWLNRMTDILLGVLQGQPVFMFQPAHVESHHQYNQGLHDITRITRYRQDNTLLGYLVFPFLVLPALSSLRKQYLKQLWHTDRRHLAWIGLQYLPLLSMWGISLWLSPLKAMIWILLPQLIGLHFLLASNYLQHAHAVPGSRYNHSRNFVGWINLFWFNVGYHTAHHDHADLHWTALPQAHEKLAPQISPTLIKRSLLAYYFKTLFLGTWLTRLRSRPLDH